MSDNLRESLEAALETSTEEVTSSAPEAAPEPVAAEPVANEAPAVEATEAPAPEAETAEPVKQEAKSQEQPKEAEETEAARRARVDRAPQSWSGTAKQTWNQLPLSVRQEVVRREQHINQVMSEAAQLRNMVTEVRQAATPYAGKLQTMGLNPAQALQRFLATDHDLSSAPAPKRAEMMAQMIKHYGIALEMLDSALAGVVTPEARQFDQVQQLLDERMRPVNQLLTTLQQQQAHAQQVQAAQATATVEQMANNPNFPHFNEVRDIMADIIDMRSSRGQQTTLEEAYRLAVLTNPELAQIEQARLQSNQVRANVSAAGQAAARAAHASSSVSGAPVSATPQVNTNNLAATIEAAMAGQFRV